MTTSINGVMIIRNRNVNGNYRESIENIHAVGVKDRSRNGTVLVAPYPVITVTDRPSERVLFDEKRDANPFFHFFECLWMLSGNYDGRYLDTFVKDFSSRFAEEDGQIWGAYGYRWRQHFDIDQLATVIELLRFDFKDRRVVIQMWDPKDDLASDVRDVPCNTQMFPRVREVAPEDYVLDLTVTCRSNDVIWGATGANAVHFSFVQEYLASMIGVGVGRLGQVSNNWHAYSGPLEKVGKPGRLDPYSAGEVMPYRIVNDAATFDDELDQFMSDPETIAPYRNIFFTHVANPMWVVHKLWREKKKEAAIEFAKRNIHALDWRRAVLEWMLRRVG